MRRLPTFKGYNVDHRLREFRRVSYGKHPSIEFIPFDSKRGQRLMQRYYRESMEKKG